jgi:cyclic di-GMP phosphodiesterase
VANVLVADDDTLVLDVLERALVAAGHAVSLAASAAEARAICAAGAAEVVLLDVEIGHESGLDLAAELRAKYPFLPVLIFSGHDDRDTWTRALAIGVYGFLPKPVGRVALYVAVENALRRGELERASAVERASLESAVAEQTRDLEAAVDDVRAARLESVYLLAKAAEWRDADTGAHLQRMSSLCALIAAQLGESEERCALVREASVLHDVGKIAIPDAILLKPGRLTSDEEQLMRRHAAIGHELLEAATSPLLRLAADIALTHHERWDGDGYPRGLAGEAIPLVGRIAAVADTFDAITSDRPYRRARSAETALAVLEEERATQFDPRLVDAFTEIPRAALENLDPPTMGS